MSASVRLLLCIPPEEGIGCVFSRWGVLLPQRSSPDTASLSHGPDLKEENLCAASGQRWRGSPDKVMLSFLVVSALGQGGSPLSLGGTCKTVSACLRAKGGWGARVPPTARRVCGSVCLS